MKKADVEKVLHSLLDETLESIFSAVDNGNQSYAFHLLGKVWGVASSMECLGFIDHSEHNDLYGLAYALYRGEPPYDEVDYEVD